jgi:hypothetical protein
MLKKYRGMDENHICQVGRPGARAMAHKALYCLIRTPRPRQRHLDVRGINTELIDQPMFYRPNPRGFAISFCIAAQTAAK